MCPKHKSWDTAELENTGFPSLATSHPYFTSPRTLPRNPRLSGGIYVYGLPYLNIIPPTQDRVYFQVPSALHSISLKVTGA